MSPCWRDFTGELEDNKGGILKNTFNLPYRMYWSFSKSGFGDITQLALHTGMRQGEILDLGRKDIDMARKVIVIMKTKNDKPRTIPMTDTLYSIFLTKSKIIPLSGYVFATANGTRISARNLIRAFHCVIKKAGIENFTFHCLRHTAATCMVQSGVDLYTVSKILGHKNIASTQRYAHHCPESLRNGVNVLNKISTNLAHSTKMEICKVV